MTLLKELAKQLAIVLYNSVSQFKLYSTSAANEDRQLIYCRHYHSLCRAMNNVNAIYNSNRKADFI